jgi:ketosteroid isomerase-like protein
MRNLLLAGCLASLAPLLANADPVRAVEETLDAFHSAAARADQETYLGLLTPEAVFLGTDGSERWQGEEFRVFVSGHFSKGEGWTYSAENRDVIVSADGKLAWFDEALVNAKLGACRGSGVLVLDAGKWRIAQYNLSVPIPNELVLSVVADIEAARSGAATAAGALKAADHSKPAVNAVLEDGAGEDAVIDTAQGAQKRCRKRHKTNTRADC